MVNQTLKKWGDSIGVTIPESFLKQLNLKEGNIIQIEATQESIIIKPKKNKYTLDELLEGMTPENFQGEIETGEQVGNEIC